MPTIEAAYCQFLTYCCHSNNIKTYEQWYRFCITPRDQQADPQVIVRSVREEELNRLNFSSELGLVAKVTKMKVVHPGDESHKVLEL